MELRRYAPNDPALVMAWQSGGLGLTGSAVDGIFGRQTEKLTIQWQLARKFRPDGVVTETIFRLRTGVLEPKRFEPEEPGAARWPLLEAMTAKPVRTKAVRLIVVHVMQHPERPDSAEAVAAWFAGKRGVPPGTSAHLCVDEDSAVRCVRYIDQAAAAPGANQDGYHIEHAGYASQTEAEWLDPRGRSMLEISAEHAARVCLVASIPARRLTVDEVRGGAAKGFCSHFDVSLAFKRSKHVDPGPGFPWEHYLERVTEWKRVLEISGPPW